MVSQDSTDLHHISADIDTFWMSCHISSIKEKKPIAIQNMISPFFQANKHAHFMV